MTTKELDFLDSLVRSTSDENIFVVSQEREKTLADLADVIGIHASDRALTGVYVYESPYWEMYEGFMPAAAYNLADTDVKLYYFPAKF
jgi:hypothetical protein